MKPEKPNQKPAPAQPASPPAVEPVSPSIEHVTRFKTALEPGDARAIEIATVLLDKFAQNEALMFAQATEMRQFMEHARARFDLEQATRQAALDDLETSRGTWHATVTACRVLLPKRR